MTSLPALIVTPHIKAELRRHANVVDTGIALALVINILSKFKCGSGTALTFSSIHGEPEIHQTNIPNAS
jgi:hypothetical protein